MCIGINKGKYTRDNSIQGYGHRYQGSAAAAGDTRHDLKGYNITRRATILAQHTGTSVFIAFDITRAGDLWPEVKEGNQSSSHPYYMGGGGVQAVSGVDSQRNSIPTQFPPNFSITEVFMARPGGAPENMKPFVKGDPRVAELARKGVAVREAKKKERQKMKDELDTLLKISLKRGDVVTSDDVMNLEEAQEQNVSVQTAIAIAMIKRALMGDVQAAQYLRDTAGEKPGDKVEIDQSLTIEAWAKNHNVKL